MIQAVLLDIGNVVLEIDFEKMVGALVYPDAERIEEATHLLNDWDVYDKFERGALTVDAFRAALEGLLKKPMTNRQFTAAWNAIFVGPVNGVDKLLSLIPLRTPLYGLSNANQVHMEFAKSEYPVLTRFKKIFTSYELGARKPEPLIYQKACAAASIPLDRALFVDDKTENVEAAKKLGMRAEQCDRSAERLRDILRLNGLIA